MKHLTERILSESVTQKQKEMVKSVFCNMFYDAKLTKDQIMQILLNVGSQDFLMALSDSLLEEDKANYIAYQPNSDMFLRYDENKEAISSQIAEYIYKFKSKR